MIELKNIQKIIDQKTVDALANLGSVIGISILIYAVVIWKVRRSER